MHKGDGYVYKVGRVWYVGFTRNGKEVRKSAKTENKGEALAFLKKEFQASQSPTWAPKQSKVTIGELVADLIAHFRATGKPAYADDCGHRWKNNLADVFDTMRAADLATAQMRDYRAGRVKAGASQTTVNRELQILRRAYRLAALETEPPKIERVPRFLITKENNARKVFITSEQLEQLRQAATEEGPWVRVLIELAYMLGWRRGELVSLRVRDVNIPERAIRLQTSKNGEPRECPLTEGLAMMLQQLVSGRHPDDTLFPFRDIRGAWRRTCKRAGIPVGRKDGITFHDFRRTSARSKRAVGVDSSVIMKMQGWLTEGQFRRYGIVAPEDQLAAMHKVEKLDSSRIPHSPASKAN